MFTESEFHNQKFALHFIFLYRIYANQKEKKFDQLDFRRFLERTGTNPPNSASGKLNSSFLGKLTLSVFRCFFDFLLTVFCFDDDLLDDTFCFLSLLERSSPDN